MSTPTYEKIQHIELTGSQASIDFTSIPQTYTDLVIKTSLRDTGGGNIASYISFNGSTANFSGRYLYGDGASVSSGTLGRYIGSLKDNATANTLNSTEIYIPNYTSSNNKSFSVDNVTENNGTNADQNIIAGLWSNTAAITSISLSPASGSFRAGSSATLYGIKSIASAPKATGGIISYVNGYWVHTFTSSGTFTPTQNLSNVEYLVVAGGGAGSVNIGGGGGAGGYRSSVVGESSGGGASAESRLSLTSGTNYTVTVGAGGTKASFPTKGSNGSDSVFGSITAVGGGAGAVGSSSNSANSGGSGGGGALSPGTANGSGTANQGYAGGAGAGSISTGGAGGGGGAGQAGSANGTRVSGKGGDGVTSSITGTAVTRAGGGGGGGGSSQNITVGAGGAGGGTSGGAGADALNAAANTGAGGGGGGVNSSDSVGYAAGNGGSGIVVVRYQ